MGSGRQIVGQTSVLSGVWHFRRLLLGTVAAAAVALLVAGGATTVVVAADEYLDGTFGTGGRVITEVGSGGLAFGALAVVQQPDGMLVAAGQSGSDFLLTRYLPDGSLDATFGTDGFVTTDFGGGGDVDLAEAVLLQPDGKLVAAGRANAGPSLDSDFGLVRYLPDGSLDATFGVGGKVTTNFGPLEVIHALVLQPDGKLVASGLPFMARYNPDGSLDTTFGDAGRVIDFGAEYHSLVLQPDGKLVSSGMTAGGDFVLTRYLSDGSLDVTFGVGGRITTDFGGDEAAFALVLQPDGKLVAAGGYSNSPESVRGNFLLARYNPDGSPDATFGTGGKVTTDFSFGGDSAHALVLQPDGRLVAAGVRVSGSGPVFALARYNGDGSLDGTFGSFGRLTTAFGGGAHANALVFRRTASWWRRAPLTEEISPWRATCRARPVRRQHSRSAPDQQPAVDGPVTTSGTLSGPAAYGAKGAGWQRRLDPAAFRRLRDQVLVRSPAGCRYAALYAAHSPEVVRLMFTDASLRTAILNGLLLWQPHVAAIVDGRGAALTVTADQARAMDVVLDTLATAGSPDLRRAIDQERRGHARTPGLSLAQSVVREIGRDVYGQ